MRVALTWYPPGEHERTAWFDDFPALPRVDDTVHFNDRSWLVTHVALVPDNLDSPTPADTGWHAECSVR